LPTGEDTSVRISVLGSGSGGNATLIATERTRVLLDAGFSRRETQKRLRAIGEPADALDAIVISHEHCDHISGMVPLAGGLHVPVYMTELARRVVPADPAEVRVMPHFELFRAGQTLAINDIEIETFTIPHDSVDPVAFRIQAEGVRVGFCTDLGYIPDSVKVHLRGCHCLILESNHDLDMLKVGPYPWVVKQRVMSRTGHLSNAAVAEFLAQDYDGSAAVLVLAHLSENNNHPALAQLSADQALTSREHCSTRLVISSQHFPTELFRF
jgi:phosphoribosyl 1,2-cyclic phosphodiesterase